MHTYFFLFRKVTYHILAAYNIRYALALNTDICICILQSKTPPNRVNWDGETSGYAKNPDNWIFL